MKPRKLNFSRIKAKNFTFLVMIMLAFSVTSLLTLTSEHKSHAATLSGVTSPDTISVEGKTLKLNGMGIRQKWFFNIYVTSLYLETSSKDPQAIINSNQVKRVELSMIKGLDAEKISSAIGESFEKSAKDKLPALKSRLDKLKKMFPATSPGDKISLTYVPSKGVVVTGKGQEKGIIEGKDFADVLFSIWIGPDAVQEDLKQSLLGNK